MIVADSQSAPVTVLVVDDEETVRVALARFLSRLGYRVAQAATAPAALAQQAADPVDVMLADIRMPEMSGLDLVPRALAQDPDVAIIMLTAVDDPRTAIDCLKLGASDYLIKPVELDELELAVHAALRRRQLEIERRGLEEWLTREVATRTRDLEEHTTAVADVALAALAATSNWVGEDAAVAALAQALGTAPEEIAADLRRRRA